MWNTLQQEKEERKNNPYKQNRWVKKDEEKQTLWLTECEAVHRRDDGLGGLVDAFFPIGEKLSLVHIHSGLLRHHLNISTGYASSVMRTQIIDLCMCSLPAKAFLLPVITIAPTLLLFWKDLSACNHELDKQFRIMIETKKQQQNYKPDKLLSWAHR